jgi:hypothetical protein
MARLINKKIGLSLLCDLHIFPPNILNDDKLKYKKNRKNEESIFTFDISTFKLDY